MDNALTKLPLVNGAGQPLKVCSDCYGGGIARKSVEAYAMRTGRIFSVGQSLTEADAKIFKKERWKFSTSRCELCQGAGMVRVGGPNA